MKVQTDRFPKPSHLGLVVSIQENIVIRQVSVEDSIPVQVINC